MGGNVWEWTASQYTDYPHRDDERNRIDDTGSRTLRGGSWYNSQGLAWVSLRLDLNPDLYDDNVGFRVVVAPIL